eukprot:1077673-Rhodomonas_salina.1
MSSDALSVGVDPNIPWFWQEALTHSSTIAVLCLFGAIFAIGVIAIMKQDEDDDEAREGIFFSVRFFSCLLFFLYDYVFMWRRFTWFINDDDAVYTPHELEDGTVKWITDAYHDASIETREKYCGYSMELPSYPINDSKCNFMLFKFEPDLIPKGHGFQAGGTKFAIGLGLCVFCMLFWCGFALKESAALQYRESSEKGAAFATTIAFLFFAIVIESQQSLVMLPLTNLRPNAFCAHLTVPTTEKYAMCLHQYAVLGLPYGLVFLIFTGIAGACASGTGPVSVFGAAAGVFCGFFCLAFLIMWFFAGFVVGVWFTFAEGLALYDLGLIKLMSVPAAVINAEFVRGVAFVLVYCIGSAGSKPVTAAKHLPSLEDVYDGCKTLSRHCCHCACIPECIRNLSIVPSRARSYMEEDGFSYFSSSFQARRGRERDGDLGGSTHGVEVEGHAVFSQHPPLAQIYRNELPEQSIMTTKEDSVNFPPPDADREWRYQPSFASTAGTQQWQWQQSQGPGMLSNGQAPRPPAPVATGPYVPPLQQPGFFPPPMMQGPGFGGPQAGGMMQPFGFGGFGGPAVMMPPFPGQPRF